MLIFAAIVTTRTDVFVDVIEDRSTPPSESICEAHAKRLQNLHPTWVRVAFYTIPVHPHDPDAYTAKTLWEDIEDNQATFAKVLDEQQDIIVSFEKPEPGAVSEGGAL